MKFFKIFTFSAAFLIITFITIGVVSPKTSYTTELIVEKPDSTVFRMFTDFNLLAQWVSSLKSVEVLSGNGSDVGSTFKQYFKGDSDSFYLVQTITANQKYSRYDYTQENDMMKSVNNVSFKSLDDHSTKVIIKTTINGKGLITRSMFPLIKSKMIKQSMADYRKLKEYIEQYSSIE